MTDIIKSRDQVNRRNRDMADGTFAEIVATAQQTLFRTTFAKVLASGADPDFFAQIGALGAGITYSQTGGNLVINSGTTTNSELILRSVVSWRDMMTLRWQTILSQRIANNSFTVELVDVIGDGLAYVINSAVSVTVTIPNNPFTAANVGQSLNLGAIAGAAGIAGRYAIASVSGATVTFTVASWPASGTGTLSLFGWNFHRCEYSGTTATAANYDTQRKGWNSGNTAATINTTASPGHMGIINSEDGMGSFLDQLIASSTTLATAMRASRVVNIPDEAAPLFLQIRVQNGTTAPASTTAWTLGMASLSSYMAQNVAINSVRPQTFNSVMPVAVNNTPNIGTITTLTGGNAAEDAATTANPLIVGGLVRTAVSPTTLVAGDAARATMTSGAALVNFPFAVPELGWSYAAAAGGILNTTTAVTIKAAAAAGVRNYITSIQVMSEALTTATELAIRDGAAGTVIWRTKIPTGGLPTTTFDFTAPIHGTAATLLEVVTLTASGAGAVYVNAQGFTAA